MESHSALLSDGSPSLAQDFTQLWREVRALKSNPRRIRLVLVKAFFYATLLAVYGARRTTRTEAARALYFYPQIPDAEYTVWKMCALLGLRRRLPREGAKTLYVFDDNDFEPRRLPEIPSIIAGNLERTINLGCTDISKTTVSRTFEDVFGYSITVDPATHGGPIVEKSDANGRHDGRVLEGPLTECDPEYVYQRLIENERSGGLVEDIRIPVVGSSVPFVYLKYRPVEKRFANENTFVRLTELQDVLTDDEVERILEICRRLELDCGELDLVRDRDTSRLYLLDVNKTCWGPPNHLPLVDCYRAMWRLAKAFETTFMSEDTGPDPRSTTAA